MYLLGITIIPIGVTRNVDNTELQRISSGDRQENINYFILRDANDLSTIVSAVNDLVIRATSQHVPAPQPVPQPVPQPAPQPLPPVLVLPPESGRV